MRVVQPRGDPPKQPSSGDPRNGLGVVMIGHPIVGVPPAQVQRDCVVGSGRVEVAAVDCIAVQRKANKWRVRAGGVIALGVEAPRAKGITVQVRLPPALPHVLIATIHFAILCRV